MPIDASIPLQYRQPQFESPINKLAQVMQLQGMQDQQMERQAARDEQNRLKTLLANPTDDLGAALTRGGFLPQAQSYAETQAKLAREKREAEKATREGLKFDFDRTKGIINEVKNAVTALKSNPASTPEMAAQAALQIGQLFKMPEEQIRGMIAKIPQDPADFRRYLDDEEKSMLTAEQRLTLFAPKLQAVPRGNVTDIMDLSGLSPTSGRTVQSVEMGIAPGDKLRSEDTRRGQNLVDARAKEAAALKAEENKILGGKETFGAATTIRKEFEDRPEVKKFREAMPVLDAAKNAPDTPQGDLQLIYAVGKVLDPASVVREGEMQLVVKSGTPMQRIEGFANYLQGGGRLSPSARKALVAALESRTNEYQKDYNEARKSTEELAKKRGLDTAEIFINDRPFSAKAAPPTTNAKGWKLFTDAKGNRAYVSPDGKSFEEVR